MAELTTYLFDLDGTLVDSLQDLTTAINGLRGDLGLAPLTPATVKSYVGDGATMLVQRALPAATFTGNLLQNFLDRYRRHLLDHTRPYAGIPAFLDSLQGTPMGVVTNKPLDMAEEVLRGLGLRPYFGTVIGGDSCSQKKPHPAPVRQALADLGSEAATAVMIGDHRTDLIAGQSAGTRTCFCTWGFGISDGNPYDYLAATPTELGRLFPRSGP
ncbi:MAG: HAD-IA family hydrolase [Desulfuromonadales bacterium]|nr:HAD-IA family hydrolase [Desulfuromonadales bacterium]MDW7757546.1 HAD-IA family hydrolase [Desulfuromonadales bacterium]